MGIINEAVKHEDLPVTIEVVEREKGETRDQWRFINMEFDSFHRLTPSELRKLGHWLVSEGMRIGREYKSNGARR